MKPKSYYIDEERLKDHDVLAAVFISNVEISDDQYAEEPPEALWIHEEILSRLILFGSAYQMHFSALIPDVYGTYNINKPQCDDLAAELETVTELTNDDLLRKYALLIREQALRVCHGASNQFLVVMGN
ncbi:hypothetical protein [Turneriella parva]|uniref:Uncharacterized protein n=1 Tax=Turneriella parva (strain ATCC BAA-1111 / DSM 21527 / NCTC 11395 / H) TaxID=869212 RepID=I4B9K1_TURPD|nr:hypothetical protein [Turneriella parva]AFM13958.1 hypothetical protein Turpa_3320 [Turneriella parva DSM 21527]